MFKEIKAIFTVVEDTAYVTGRWKEDRSDLKFEVKRYRSGSTAYGDRSAHSVEILNHPETYTRHYDTRYAGISVRKREWIAYWKEHIEDEYELKVTVSEYEEIDQEEEQ